MSTPSQPQRRLPRALGVRTADEGHKVTTLELLFDLVFVLAFTQVTYLMSHGDAPTSVAQGTIVLALLWFSWSSFAWLGNQAHANAGLLRAALIVAMAAAFVLSLAIPEAFHDLEGGLYAPLVFACSYAVVRLVHLTTYFVASASDAVLRRQVLLTFLLSALPSIVLVTIGAAASEEWRLGLWGAAVAVDLIAVFLTSKYGGGSWRIQSVSHFTERHRLIVILALGESIVALGVAVSLDPVTTAIIVGAVFAVALTIGLWWAYFQRLDEDAEHLFERAEGTGRAKIALEAYTYLHLPMVLGVILTALGIELVMGHLDEDHLGWFGGSVLGAGVGIFLAGTAAFWGRVSQQVLKARVVAAAAAVAAIPLWSSLPGLGALAGVVAIVCVLVIVESRSRRLLSAD